MDGFISGVIQLFIFFLVVNSIMSKNKKKKAKQKRPTQTAKTTSANTSNNERFAPLVSVLNEIRDGLDDKPEMPQRKYEQTVEGSSFDNEGSYSYEGRAISTQGKAFGSEGKAESMQGKYIGMEGYISQFSDYQPFDEPKVENSKWIENFNKAYKGKKTEPEIKIIPDKFEKEELLRAVVMSEILNRPKFKSKYY
ncbi:MAG: hypothetical protein GYA87_06700 [Christensenellaceae bacterium]|nr:hypothetical protein [Christensenellaceae bacterium]